MSVLSAADSVGASALQEGLSRSEEEEEEGGGGEEGGLAFCDCALCPIFRRWELAAVLQVGPWLAPSPPPLLYAAF